MRDDYTFITEQWLPAELDDVFAFFSESVAATREGNERGGPLG